MKGLTALVVNHWNGLGLNVVQQLAKQGCNIVVNTSRNHDDDDDRIGTIQNEYQQSQIISLAADLQKETETHDLVEKIVDRFQTVDIVVFNNQDRRNYRAAIEEFPLEHWREMIDRNLIATFGLIKTLWPHMKRQYFGRIIHLADEYYLIEKQYQSATTTLHHALIGLNKALSIEGTPFGITSNIICPGCAKFNTVEQLNHIKTLEDLLVFLCSNQARTISGRLIPWPR